jgi:hypothetical protein
MVKRLPKQNIVKGPKRILPAGHPLLAFYDPSEVIIEGEFSEYDSIGQSFPSGNLVARSGSAEISVIKPGALFAQVIEETTAISEKLNAQVEEDRKQATIDEAIASANAAAAQQIISEAFREKTDVPEISDIEVVLNEKYFDEIGRERAKVVIKVKNSSKNKISVNGVDARIYQPRGTE